MLLLVQEAEKLGIRLQHHDVAALREDLAIRRQAAPEGVELGVALEGDAGGGSVASGASVDPTPDGERSWVGPSSGPVSSGIGPSVLKRGGRLNLSGRWWRWAGRVRRPGHCLAVSTTTLLITGERDDDTFAMVDGSVAAGASAADIDADGDLDIIAGSDVTGTNGGLFTYEGN